ncbi:type VI secretion system baseplate subunit TssG [Apibacter sp.]|uniref:type VI secretion system baseplate subunit TssG n=1 Tax=Apibacter sp. TaxID=2023709 RepID=UPI0025E62272|nr:type VI secretion system baseplate subunit TssG [Apibacter sp.]MCT6869885.1 type VI secretion system baseplate subunit TssG [Apibacter sp.]
MNTIEKDTLLEEIKNTINSIKDDLKAEVIISEILEQIDSKEQNILVDYKGQFKRPYRKDVLGAELINYNYDLTEYVKINLSRDGIYDTLPESLIHELSSEKPQKTVSDMTEQFKAHKKEEEYARKFFFPFENEFFIKALERENIEKEILLELNGSKPLDFFYDFWHIDRDLPPILVSKLIRILPYLHKIVGNLQMTVNCLSYLLDEKVEIAEQGYKEQSSSEQEINLGESRLGLDMISGSAYMDYSLYLEFKIGPLKKTSFLDYIHQGKLKKFIELFYDYFLPMEVDVKTSILLETETEIFNLTQNTILGITTRI